MLHKHYLNEIKEHNLLKRYAQGEVQATSILYDLLKSFKPHLQEFENSIPIYPDYALEINNKKIDAVPICFESGDGNDFVFSTFDEDLDFEKSYIATNTYCPEISRHTFTRKPSWSIKPKDYEKIKTLKNIKIKSYIEVEKYTYTSANILVGNTLDPNYIFYSHIDTVENGVIDNLSGVLVMLKLLEENPSLLDNALFVFSGNEELSYDFPIYWGYGYRRFEREYRKIMQSSQNIIVDCIAFGELKVATDKEILLEGFPVSHDILLESSKMFTCDFNKLMSVYHSSLDNLTYLDEVTIDNTPKDILKTLQIDPHN
jgi:hypothetical protein